MRELVHQRDVRMAGEHRVHVHLFEGGPAVLQPGTRDDFQALEQGGGMRAAVRLGERHHHVGAALGAAVPLAEHGVGLADAGRGSEVDPQVPAPRTAAGTSRLARFSGAYPVVAFRHFRPVSFSALLASLQLTAAHTHCEALRRRGEFRMSGRVGACAGDM